MSMDAIRWAYAQRCKPGPKSTLICAAWHADRESWIAIAGIETIAAETGQDECTIRRHLSYLASEKVGLIERKRRHVGEGRRKGERLSDGIQLNPTQVGNLPATQAGNSPTNTSAQSEETSGQFARDKRAICARQPGNLPNAYIEEPTIEPSKGTQSVGALPCDTTSKKRAKAPKKKRPSSENTVPDGWPDVMAQAEAVNYWDGVGRHDLSARVAEIAANAHDWHDAKATSYARWNAVWRQWFRREASRPPSSAAPARGSRSTLAAAERYARRHGIEV